MPDEQETFNSGSMSRLRREIASVLVLSMRPESQDERQVWADDASKPEKGEV